MFCESCGKPFNEGAQFCPNCGAEASIPKPVAQVTKSPGRLEPQKKNGKRYAWMFLLLIPILFSALNAIPATVLTSQFSGGPLFIPTPGPGFFCSPGSVTWRFRLQTCIRKCFVDRID